MRTKITCTICVISSNEITDPSFKGDNKLVLTLPQCINDPMGFSDTVLEVTKVSESTEDEDSYQLTIISSQLASKNLQIEFIEKISEHLSFLINRSEQNPRFGNIFVKVNWFDFNAIPIQEADNSFQSVIHLSERLSITSTRPLQILEKDFYDANYTDILRFYFDGLRAEHKKSKYFHWFLILEYLENSDKYKQMFSHDKLFNQAESKIIDDAANKMSDGTKKGAVKNLLSRTREFRSAKLLKIINAIGITTYLLNGQSIELIEETLKTITVKRNEIFHNGSSFPEDILWNHLFPLATLIVEKITINKISIEAAKSSTV